MITLPRLTFILTLLLISISAVPSVFAHVAGQPQVITVNGKDPNPYLDEFVKTSTEFSIADETVFTPTLVGTPVKLSMIRSRIPLTPEVTAKLQFYWNMGDGKRYEMQDEVTHTYSTAGSYLVTAYVKSPDAEPRPIESILLHIVPSLTYRLPQATIHVDGRTSPGKSYAYTLNSPTQFQAVTAEDASAPIVSYRWSIRKGEEYEGRELKYNFKPDTPYTIAVLEVKDANGLISQDYTYLSATGDSGVVSTSSASPTPTSSETSSGSRRLMFLLFLGIPTVLVLLIVLRKTRKTSPL